MTMASHGVPRVSEQLPLTQDAREKEAVRIKGYQTLVADITRMLSAGQFDETVLDATSKLLKQNPEYYTIWNYRRRILLAQIQQTEQAASGNESVSTVSGILSSDLIFLVPLMKKYPKCYWLWNHRAWLLQQASARLAAPEATKFWTQELGLDNKMLQQDKRNFHGWGYRRQLVTELERLRHVAGTTGPDASMAQEEYDYTRQMIGQDLSNFSAWHARSKLILRILEENAADAADRQAMLDRELDLIHEALIDPRDQSLWFYHQFLMESFQSESNIYSIAPDLSIAERKDYLSGEIEYVMEALDGAEDVKWIYLSLIQLACAYRRLGPAWPASAKPDQVRGWMDELQKLDPMRANRWDDWTQTLAQDLH